MGTDYTCAPVDLSLYNLVYDLRMEASYTQHLAPCQTIYQLPTEGEERGVFLLQYFPLVKIIKLVH